MSSVVAAAQALDRELRRSEKMLWSGAPRQRVVLRPTDGFLIPFSVLWTGFVVFWEYQVISRHAPLLFLLWGMPFLLAGAYFVFGRFLVDSHQRARTCYAVTDERIIIVSGLGSREVKSLPLQTLSEMTMRERSDGSGTITFGPVDTRFTIWTGIPYPGANKQLPPMFELIPDVRSVYEMIWEAQTSSARRRG